MAKHHVRKLGAMKQRDRNRQGQYSLQENAPSGMFSPTRPISHYLLIRTSTLGILSEVTALVIQLLSIITFTNWASGLKNTSYLNHCSWQGGMVLPIGKQDLFPHPLSAHWSFSSDHQDTQSWNVPYLGLSPLFFLALAQ